MAARPRRPVQTWHRAFSRGGLVVDGGRGAESKPAPIISHLPFSEVWRIVAVVDPHRHGVYGSDEMATFAKLAPMPDVQAAHICRLILMKALPALAEHDLGNFGAAIKEVQMLLGDYFAPAQGGGRFASPDVAAVLAAVDGAGASGIGQSSWALTGFAFSRQLGTPIAWLPSPATIRAGRGWTSGFAEGSITVRRSLRTRMRTDPDGN